MRPDEHKKRKNTQYKKKHGIKSDGKTQNGTKDEETKAKDVKHANRKSETEGRYARLENKTDQISTDDLPSKDEGEISYSKRKLVSNWSRYDDMPSDDEDDIPVQRGEDFKKLLAEAGGSAAQFRFKDEEDWSGVVGDDRPSVLALDLEAIAQSIHCLPLHQRLGLSQDLFTTEQLEEIQAAADENRSKYEASDASATRLEKNSDISAHRNTHTQYKTVNFDQVKNTMPMKPEMVTNKHVPKDSERPKDKECNITNDTEKQKTPVKNAEITSLEDDLDQLLSLDKPGKDITKSATTAVQNDSVSKKNEKPVRNESKVVKADSSIKESVKEDNLEDWLDSMLDD